MKRHTACFLVIWWHVLTASLSAEIHVRPWDVVCNEVQTQTCCRSLLRDCKVGAAVALTPTSRYLNEFAILDSPRWFSQRRSRRQVTRCAQCDVLPAPMALFTFCVMHRDSAKRHIFGGCARWQGLWPPNSNLAVILYDAPTPKLHRPMFSCSEAIVLTNPQTHKPTHKQIPAKTCNILCYATTLGKNGNRIAHLSLLHIHSSICISKIIDNRTQFNRIIAKMKWCIFVSQCIEINKTNRDSSSSFNSSCSFSTASSWLFNSLTDFSYACTHQCQSNDQNSKHNWQLISFDKHWQLKNCWLWTLPSARQHPSYADCLAVKREYYQNCSVLDCVTQCSQSAAHLCKQFL